MYEAGKFKLWPTVTSVGATNCTCVAEAAPVALAQLLIQVVKIWPQALGSASQQLWPPDTFTTISEVDGCDKLTTVLACAYARFTSSLRAKFGICAGVVALWHWPQRFCARTWPEKFTSNAWTSAVAGAGPV